MLTGTRKQLKCGGWKKVGLGKPSLPYPLTFVKGYIFICLFYSHGKYHDYIFLCKKNPPFLGDWTIE